MTTPQKPLCCDFIETVKEPLHPPPRARFGVCVGGLQALPHPTVCMGGGGDRAPPQGDFGGTPRFWGSGVAGLCSQQRVLLPQRPAVAEDPVEAGGGLRARLPLDLGVTALGGCDLNGGGGHKMGAGGTKWGAKRLGDKQDYKELGKVTKNWGSQRDVGRSEQLINSPGGGAPRDTPIFLPPPLYPAPPKPPPVPPSPGSPSGWSQCLQWSGSAGHSSGGQKGGVLGPPQKPPGPPNSTCPPAPQTFTPPPPAPHYLM